MMIINIYGILSEQKIKGTAQSACHDLLYLVLTTTLK